MKAEPNNLQVKQLFWEEERAYKSLVRSKKRFAVTALHSGNLSQRIRESSGGKYIWSDQTKSNDDEIPIPVEKLGAYFRSLLEGPGDSPHVCWFETDPILYDPIFAKHSTQTTTTSYGTSLCQWV